MIGICLQVMLVTGTSKVKAFSILPHKHVHICHKSPIIQDVMRSMCMNLMGFTPQTPELVQNLDFPSTDLESAESADSAFVSHPVKFPRPFYIARGIFVSCYRLLDCS